MSCQGCAKTFTNALKTVKGTEPPRAQRRGSIPVRVPGYGPYPRFATTSHAFRDEPLTTIAIIAGVDDVNVDMDKQNVRVTGTADRNALLKAVKGTGKQCSLA